MTDLMLAYEETTEAQDGYIKAESYYAGTQPEFFASRRLRRALEKTGNPWRLNFCRTVVKSVLDLLEITGASTSNVSHQQWIDQLWADNTLDSETDQVHEWFLAHGDAYAMVWPDETMESGVSIMYNSARTTRMLYHLDRPRIARLGTQVWRREDEKVRVNLYYPDRIEKYVSKVKSPKTEQGFEPFIDVINEEDGSAVWPIVNPYNQIPLFHFRTESPYGRPEHIDGFSPQDMINKLVINQMNTVDFHGFPQRYVVTEPDVDDDDGGLDDAFDDLGDEDAEAPPRLKQTPDAVWWLKRVKEVGQFDVADSDAFLKPLDRYISSMASLTSTPLHDFEASNAPQSGESRRIARTPLLKKVSSRRQRLEPTWKEVIGFAARVSERDLEEVSLNWAPMQNSDDQAAWELIQKKQDAGVPRDRTLIEAGYEPSEVKSWPMDVSAIADASQKLGVGVQLGVIDEATARGLMSSMIDMIGGERGGS